MQKNNLSAMVEAGILSSISIMFAAISLYLPLIGGLIGFLWPVPLIILGVRHGFKWSVMALITSGLVITMLVGPALAVPHILGLGFIGLTLGYCLGKQQSTKAILFFGYISSLLSKILVFGLLFYLTGFNPFDVDPEATALAMEKLLDFYRQLGFSEETLVQYKAMMQQTSTFVQILLPSVLIVGSFADTYLNLLVARTILKRLGTTLPEISDIPPFTKLLVPDWILLAFGVILLGVSYTENYPDTLGYEIFANLSLIFMTPFLLQGLAISWFWIEKKQMSSYFKALTVFLLFVLPPAIYLFLILGMLDYIFDFRKIRPKRS